MTGVQLAVFGSAARGGMDANSDFDVIAVCLDVSAVRRSILEAEVNQLFKTSVGLSIYSKNRLRALWQDGSPFAWHLYLQAKPVHDDDKHFLRSWGTPSVYSTAVADCKMMLGVIDSASARLQDRIRGCECYEAGLLYVGTRNIGMFASLALTGTFDFSRAASFSLEPTIFFPMTRDEYAVLTRARHASVRGGDIPSLDPRWLVGAGLEVQKWARTVIAQLQ